MCGLWLRQYVRSGLKLPLFSTTKGEWASQWGGYHGYFGNRLDNFAKVLQKARKRMNDLLTYSWSPFMFAPYQALSRMQIADLTMQIADLTMHRKWHFIDDASFMAKQMHTLAYSYTAGRRAGRQYWWWRYDAGIWLPCFWCIGSYFKMSMLEEALPF